MREQRPLFESPAVDGALEARAVDGVDELNRLFRYEIHVRRPGVTVGGEEAAALLEAPGTLRFVEDGVVLHEIHGLVAAVTAEVDPEADTTDLTIELVPRVWQLTQRHGSELFLEVNVPEVLRRKLRALGLVEGADFVLALRESYPVREIIAQYDETDHAFVARLCEHHGIVTFFEHRDGKDVWILTDTAATHHAITRSSVRVLRDRTHPAAWNVKTALRRVPSKVLAHDYNYRSPLVDLNDHRPVPRPAAAGQWVEYGPHSKTPADTTRIAALRSEGFQARHHVVTALTSEASVRAGGTFRLIDTVGEAEELLLTRVVHRFRRPDEAHAGSPAWESEIAAIPAKVVFRPEQVTPWPRIPGLLNAVVDGAIKGDYAELDEAGRYHLRMRNDLSGRTDLGATHPVRMMQPHAGANYGMHFPLRPGTEVLVGFVNGDPDRPVIVGSAPNPTTVSPVEQRNQTQNVLRTGSNNEMVIEDQRGSERIRIHTPHKNTTVQLGAIEEPEEGALTRTEASISEASRVSNNEATDRKVVVADTSAALLGRSAVIAVGSPGITRAAGRGIDEPSALSPEELTKDLDHLSTSPEKRANPEGHGPNESGSGDGSEGGSGSGAGADGKNAAGESGTSTGGGVTAPGTVAAATVPYSGKWSDVGADVSERTQVAVSELVRAAAATTDDGLDRAQGRLQGEPLGVPLDPSGIIAAERTAALIGRETSFVFGDRVAALASHDTASVMGKETAQLKSPGEVEIAAGKEVKVSSPGTVDMQSKLMRIVAGYYPTEAPPLEDGTTIGVMSRKDLRFISVEDCILVCAKKNLIGTAHTGDIRLTAKKTASINAGSIYGGAGSITLKSSDTIDIDADGNITITSAGNIAVEAAGDLVLKGATVTVEGDSITLKGNTTVKGDLTVTGALKGG